MSTNTNLVSAVMDVVMAVAESTPEKPEHTPCSFPTLPRDKQVWCDTCHKWTDHSKCSQVTEGTDKSGTIVTKAAAHARRGAFAPQRTDESFAQYQERLRVGRMAESERKRLRRAALKTGVFNKAVDTLAGANIAALPGSVAGNRASLEDRQLAVAASVPLKDLHTRATEDVIAGLTTRYAPFSKAQYKRGHYDAFVMNNDAPYSVWPRYHGITTRDPETIKKQLDTHFAKVSTRNVWKKSNFQVAWSMRPNVNTTDGFAKGMGSRTPHNAGTGAESALDPTTNATSKAKIDNITLNEHVYQSMNAAQRSKANPLLRIGVTPDSMPYVNTFVSASPAPFTQTERLDHSRVAPTAGASDKMVAKHAPTQGTDKQGKPLPFTYGGTVPPIPSDMHGLWCDRALGGVYGSGETDIAYQPFHYSKSGKVLPDSFNVRDRVMDATYNQDRHVRTMAEFAPDLPIAARVKTPKKGCSFGGSARGVSGTPIAAAGTVTPALTVASYPRMEACYI